MINLIELIEILAYIERNLVKLSIIIILINNVK